MDLKDVTTLALSGRLDALVASTPKWAFNLMDWSVKGVSAVGSEKDERSGRPTGAVGIYCPLCAPGARPAWQRQTEEEEPQAPVKYFHTATWTMHDLAVVAANHNEKVHPWTLKL